MARARGCAIGRGRFALAGAIGDLRGQRVEKFSERSCGDRSAVAGRISDPPGNLSGGVVHDATQTLAH